jgi:serine/threonine protein phosphatase 1
MRLIAIGDIHGYHDKLSSILDQVQPTSKDRLVFLGDYIDRGPDSRKVIDTLLALQKRFEHAVFLRGNHEQLMLDALKDVCPDCIPEGCLSLGVGGNADGEKFLLWAQNGGWACLESYGVEIKNMASILDCWKSIPREHIDFLVNTQLYHRQDGFLFVHAGAYEQRPLDEQVEALLWERHAPPGVNEIHVVGHTPCSGLEPCFEDTRYNLDTGSGHGRMLTACDVLTKEFWQAAGGVKDAPEPESFGPGM